MLESKRKKWLQKVKGKLGRSDSPGIKTLEAHLSSSKPVPVSATQWATDPPSHPHDQTQPLQPFPPQDENTIVESAQYPPQDQPLPPETPAVVEPTSHNGPPQPYAVPEPNSQPATPHPLKSPAPITKTYWNLSLDQLLDHFHFAGSVADHRPRDINQALCWAASDDEIELVDELLARKATSFKSPRPWLRIPALNRAIVAGNYKVAMRLLDAIPTATDLTDTEGKTPLNVACERGMVRIIDPLIRAGADINAQDRLGRSPMHSAVLQENVDAVTHLTARGVDVSLKDHARLTPGDMARRQGSFVIEELLKQARDKQKKAMAREAKVQIVTERLTEDRSSPLGRFPLTLAYETKPPSNFQRLYGNTWDTPEPVVVRVRERPASAEVPEPVTVQVMERPESAEATKPTGQVKVQETPASYIGQDWDDGFNPLTYSLVRDDAASTPKSDDHPAPGNDAATATALVTKAPPKPCGAPVSVISSEAEIAIYTNLSTQATPASDPQFDNVIPATEEQADEWDEPFQSVSYRAAGPNCDVNVRDVDPLEPPLPDPPIVETPKETLSNTTSDWDDAFPIVSYKVFRKGEQETQTTAASGGDNAVVIPIIQDSAVLDEVTTEDDVFVAAVLADDSAWLTGEASQGPKNPKHKDTPQVVSQTARAPPRTSEVPVVTYEALVRAPPTESSRRPPAKLSQAELLARQRRRERDAARAMNASLGQRARDAVVRKREDQMSIMRWD